MIVNGVTLPDIPAGMLAQYPYAVIFQCTVPGYNYGLIATDSAFFYASKELVGFDYADGVLASLASAGVGYLWQDGSSEWAQTEPELFLPMGELVVQGTSYGTYTLEWANHDVFIATEFISEDDVTIGTEIYFAKSEEEKPSATPTRYSISKAILDDIVHAIQFVRNNDKKLKPEDIAGVIRRMLVLPSAYAETTLSGLRFNTTAVGGLPTVYQGTATSTITGLSFEASASGELN